MPRAPRPAPPCTAYRGYLRGRLAACGLLDPKEAKLYADPALGTPILLGYTLGATSDPAAPLLSEVEVAARVHSLLGPDAGATDPGQLPDLPSETAAAQVGA